MRQKNIKANIKRYLAFKIYTLFWMMSEECGDLRRGFHARHPDPRHLADATCEDVVNAVRRISVEILNTGGEG